MSAADAAALQNLIALGQSAGGTAQANNAALPSQPAGQMSSKTGTMQTNNPYAFGGAIARLPKAADRFQTTTTTQPSSTPKFGTRLLTALTETFFNSIALAMSTPAFVTVLENALRPLVLPAATSQPTSSGTTDGTTGGTTNGTTDGTTNGTSGSGIENLPSPTGGGTSGGTV
jgi:hypothetical protein